jgi:hypothetical protein
MGNNLNLIEEVDVLLSDGSLLTGSLWLTAVQTEKSDTVNLTLRHKKVPVFHSRLREVRTTYREHNTYDMGIPHHKGNSQKDSPRPLGRRQAGDYINNVYRPIGPQISSSRNFHNRYTNDNYKSDQSPPHHPPPPRVRPGVTSDVIHRDSNVYNHSGPAFPPPDPDNRVYTRHEDYETGDPTSDSSSRSSAQRLSRSETHISRFHESPGLNNPRPLPPQAPETPRGDYGLNGSLRRRKLVKTIPDWSSKDHGNRTDTLRHTTENKLATGSSTPSEKGTDMFDTDTDGSPESDHRSRAMVLYNNGNSGTTVRYYDPS